MKCNSYSSIPELNRRSLSGVIWSPSNEVFAFVDIPYDYSSTILYLVNINTSKVKKFDVSINYHCGTTCYCHAGEGFFLRMKNTITYRIPTAKNKDIYDHPIFEYPSPLGRG